MVMEYLRTEYINGAKTNICQFNTMLKKNNADYECDNDLKCTNLFKSGKNSQTLGDAFIKNLKSSKLRSFNRKRFVGQHKQMKNIDGYMYNKY